MFVRNAWYVAAAIAEISDKPLARTILNEPIVLFKNGRGEICALEDRCCHRGAPLALGDPTEAGIRCGYHGMEFNRDGVCTFIPGQTIIPKRARVKSYPAVAKTDYVWIWMGRVRQGRSRGDRGLSAGRPGQLAARPRHAASEGQLRHGP